MTIILNEAVSINNILGKFTEQKLPIKLSYKLMKILSELEPELQFYQTKLQELIDSCAEKNADGSIVYTDNNESIKLIPEKSQEFTTQYNELFNMEIEINDFNFTLDELENLELTPKELFVLNSYIVDTE